MIMIVDYDMGNVGSIVNMLRKCGETAQLSHNPSDFVGADGIILPGVGAFDKGMQSLQSRGLIDPLLRAVDLGTPILGICLGMQLLTRGSEEGQLAGLGIVPAETRRLQFADATRLRIPHMGWSDVLALDRASAEPSLANSLFAQTEHDQRYYFVHSYHVHCDTARDVLATAHYGVEIAAAIGTKNVAGTQFHPEKSLRFGARLMQNFVDFCATRTRH